MLNVTDVVEFTKLAQVFAHGQIHTMIGGVSHVSWKSAFLEWAMEPEWAETLSIIGFGIYKNLWRASVISCPDDCDLEDSLEDCACSCPDFSTWTDESVRNVLKVHLGEYGEDVWTSMVGEYLGLKVGEKKCWKKKGRDSSQRTGGGKSQKLRCMHVV